ncbi:type 1 glutamine amidotransferase [Spectribacter hydrogenoxidans]|uniref:Type 1 glutamine amidotransferase n=1 Tax=Spectribacter hydrogenoxidans TaxID=3075608 RepID=A0ABU3BWA0_9GAMM|nr:type 1 glutamine amidotransferase [Salinisphaera sp. W335]MDT0633573.1 type 1 glutamine amidotransferase [Salinisphaera sp. W335]
MGTRRPLIAVTGPDGRAVPAWWFTRLAVTRAGGRAVRLTPDRPGREIHPDAVIIGGGEDIAPALYDALGSHPPTAPDSGRDAFELGVIQASLTAGRPLLGICRGAQLINVALGGTLYQDLRSRRRKTCNRRRLWPSKRVRLDPGSQLENIMNTTTVSVNSLHHQAVANPGTGLRITARDDDAIAQGIEADSGRFCIGVQWHPEYLPWQARQQRLFRALVTAAARRSTCTAA